MLTLPLAKISEARDTAPNETKFTWTHETQELVVVLGSRDHSDARQLLKVVQGTHVRHLVEAERLINEGRNLIHTLREHGAELAFTKQQGLQRLGKLVAVALTVTQVRRLQLKFKHNDDYENAYNHLAQLGLHMEAAGAGQSRIPTHSSKAMLSQPAPLIQPYSPAAQTSTHPSPRSRLADMSNRPYSALTAPTSVESQLQEDIRNRPSTANASDTNIALDRGALPEPLRPPEYFARPGLSTSDVADHSPLNFPPTSSIPATSQADYSCSDGRLATAILFEQPDTAETALPPRRELPFARSSVPRSAGSDSARPSSRPSTSMMGPPPLPARVTSLRPTSARSASQDTELPPLPRPTIVDSAQPQPSWMQQPPRTPNQDRITPPSDALIPVYEDQEQRSSSSGSFFSPLSYNRASSTTLPLSQPLSSLGSAAQNIRRSTSNSPITTPPTSGTRCQSKSVPGQDGEFNAGASTDLAAYAMQSDEGRRAALNEFVYRQLQDDNFLTLMEDMETCWARHGPTTK
ncbi:hypothetical protein ACEQ8H_006242 [Pleosporales sp. CAS-2024a]